MGFKTEERTSTDYSNVNKLAHVHTTNAQWTFAMMRNEVRSGRLKNVQKGMMELLSGNAKCKPDAKLYRRGIASHLPSNRDCAKAYCEDCFSVFIVCWVLSSS